MATHSPSSQGGKLSSPWSCLAGTRGPSGEREPPPPPQAGLRKTPPSRILAARAAALPFPGPQMTPPSFAIVAAAGGGGHPPAAPKAAVPTAAAARDTRLRLEEQQEPAGDAASPAIGSSSPMAQNRGLLECREEAMRDGKDDGGSMGSGAPKPGVLRMPWRPPLLITSLSTSCHGDEG